MAKRPRVLLVAEMANPEWVSVPLEGWSHSRALAEVVDAHLVTQIRNAGAIDRAGWTARQYTALDSEWVAKPISKLNAFLREKMGLGWTLTTALESISYYAFEREVWRAFGPRIVRREYDIVHRLTPLSPTIPSFLLSQKCSDCGVPFIWGPVNGGVPWPKQFRSVQNAEGEWLSYLRAAHRLLPGYTRTRRLATALIAGSCSAWDQFAGYHERCVYIPENGVDPSRFNGPQAEMRQGLLRVAFVGRLVPYKGADLLIEAAAPLLKEHRLVVDIIGDGPEMPRLKRLRKELGVEDKILLDGWVSHTELQARLIQAQVFAFPSVREFGGAAVLEAMVSGLVPVVIGYAGPNELVSNSTGIRIPLGSRDDIVAHLRSALYKLTRNPESLVLYSDHARRRVLSQFTWDMKAQQVLEVYRWVLSERDKPNFGMPLPD